MYFGDNEFFITKKDEDNEVIFDKNGKEYITANSIHNVANDLSEDVFVILEYDDYYTVYNVTKQKEILKSKEEPDCNNGYITISQDNKIEFYSYITGKLFYSIKKIKDTFVSFLSVTIKIVTMATAVEEKIVDLDKDHFYDSGKVTVDGTTMRCWKAGGHGNQTFLQVLENSCNLGVTTRTFLSSLITH